MFKFFNIVAIFTSPLDLFSHPHEMADLLINLEAGTSLIV
jgi:hypothetical protein